MYKPTAGNFGLSTIGGPVGWWVNLGQALLRDGSRYTHAFIVLDDDTVLEAAPGGARILPLNYYVKRGAVFSDLPLNESERAQVVANARLLEGNPYSFLDYLSLAVKHGGVNSKRLNKYIADKGHMICSQLVDEVYLRSGIHLFQDGREPQDVTPGDLANLLLEQGWHRYK